MDVFNKDIDLTEEIDDIEKKFKKDKEVAIIGLGDSIGFSTIDYNYLDRLVRSIDFDCKLSVFNGHFLTTDTERQIQDIILSGITLGEVKKINQLELDMLLSEKLKDKRLPIDKKIFKISKAILGYKDRTFNSGYEQLSLMNILGKSNSSHVFYSANSNLFYKYVPKSFETIEQEQRKRNYDLILNTNPNSTIYAIGLVAPNNFDSTLDNVKRHNEFYQELSSQFGMVYIDPKGLNKYLKKECGKLTLVPEGVALLTIKCIEAMHENLATTHNTSSTILTNTLQNSPGVDLLIDNSEARIETYYDAMDEKTYFYPEKLFTASRIHEEKERFKILKKLKKEETYFE